MLYNSCKFVRPKYYESGGQKLWWGPEREDRKDRQGKIKLNAPQTKTD